MSEYFNSNNELDLYKDPNDILNEYGVLFEKLDNENWVEKVYPNISGYSRVVITPSNAILLSSMEVNKIWDVDMGSEDGHTLLSHAIEYSNQIDPKDITSDMNNPEIILNDRTYYVGVLHYNSTHTTNTLRFLLEKKLHKYKEYYDMQYQKYAYLINPEKYLKVFTPEQLVGEYPKMFFNPFENSSYGLFSKNISNGNGQRDMIYFERTYESESFDLKGRFLCTNDGIFVMYGRDNNEWDFDITNTAHSNLLLREIHKAMLKNENTKNKNIIEVRVGSKKYTLEHLKPSIQSSNYIINTLDTRLDLCCRNGS